VLLLAGLGANRTALVILLFHLACILFGIVSIHFHVPEWITFALALGVFALYYAGMCHAWTVMKKVKSFREWAGFEDRRESRETSGRRSKLDRRKMAIQFTAEDRRTEMNRRCGVRRL
jgi:hypothetical protein